MFSPSQAKTIIKKIRRYAAAEVADSWKGGGDPIDRPEIEAELAKACEDLGVYINKLQNQTKLPTPRGK
jgi:hypothetical protein